jgi:hypothetical protein
VDVDTEGDLSGGVETDGSAEELSRSRSSTDESLIESLLPEVVRRRAAREVSVSSTQQREGQESAHHIAPVVRTALGSRETEDVVSPEGGEKVSFDPRSDSRTRNAPLQVLRNTQQPMKHRNPRERVELRRIVRRRQTRLESRDELHRRTLRVVQPLPIVRVRRFPLFFVAGEGELDLKGGEGVGVAEESGVWRREKRSTSFPGRKGDGGMNSRSTSIANMICASRFATSSSTQARQRYSTSCCLSSGISMTRCEKRPLRRPSWTKDDWKMCDISWSIRATKEGSG